MKKAFLKIKGRTHQSNVGSVMLHGRKKWGLKEDEKAILKRTEKPIIRAIC